MPTDPNDVDFKPLPFPIFPRKSFEEDSLAVVTENLKQLYKSELGVIMSTFKEMQDVTAAIHQLAVIYSKVMEDGKIDVQDLNYLPELVTFIQLGKEAIHIDEPVDLSLLTVNEIQEIFSDIVESIFIALGTNLPGIGNTASYTELVEIFDAWEKVVEIFHNATEDGKLTLTDLLSNLGGFMDLTELTEKAIQVEVIDVKELSIKEITNLVNRFIGSVFSVIESVKNLGKGTE